MYRLRELERKDVPIINSWRSDKELIDNVGAPFRFINMEVDAEWFNSYMLNRGNAIRCSIINEDSQIVGLVSLTNINRIELSVLESNKRALSLYDKVGFQREGIKREAVYKNGKFMDMIVMAILKEDFMEENSE